MICRAALAQLTAEVREAQQAFDKLAGMPLAGAREREKLAARLAEAKAAHRAYVGSVMFAGEAA